MNPEEDVTRLLRGLMTAADEPYRGPGPTHARRIAAARRRRHGLAAAATALVLIAAIGVVFGFAGRHDTDRLRPVTPKPTAVPAPTPGYPTPSGRSSEPDGSSSAPPSATAARTALRPIDWRNSVMNLPSNDVCPLTRVQFSDGVASLPPWHYSIVPSAPPVYGDVDRDGLTDAVVVITCYGNATVGGPETRFMIVAFTGNAKGGPTPIGFVDGMQAYVDPLPSLRENGRTIVVDWRPDSGGTLVRTYRWNGTRFVSGG
ncbi:hypothetical protein [Cryptosporangium phraense]|uniref:Uncharacterized protein n=1 Tax=Cryptosporangium phraense TaxID=2593070 RepID=A0A545AXK3_9ACTN|nr:hypothetical protein [Cryptosporangium phraense]TQS46011.1 hypothetical protein FL583_05845 [Cryptosporangium phraense]